MYTVTWAEYIKNPPAALRYLLAAHPEFLGVRELHEGLAHLHRRSTVHHLHTLAEEVAFRARAEGLDKYDYGVEAAAALILDIHKRKIDKMGQPVAFSEHEDVDYALAERLLWGMECPEDIKVAAIALVKKFSVVEGDLAPTEKNIKELSDGLAPATLFEWIDLNRAHMASVGQRFSHADAWYAVAERLAFSPPAVLTAAGAR